MQTLTTFDPPVNHLAEQAARADRSINPNPAAAPCWSVWWTPDRPGNVRVVRLSTSRLMAAGAASYLRIRHGGRTAVLHLDRSEARRIARAAPVSGVVVDTLRVSDLARAAGCDPALMRRAIGENIAERLAGVRESGAAP